jgi:hypothetical protein
MLRSVQCPADDERASAPWEELRASTDFRELFRYRKAGVERVYNLRVLSEDAAEVWFNDEPRDGVSRTILRRRCSRIPATPARGCRNRKRS